MVSLFSTSRRPRVRSFFLPLVLVLIACLFVSVVHGQSDSDSESESDPEKPELLEQLQQPEQPEQPEQAPSPPSPPAQVSPPEASTAPAPPPVAPAAPPGSTPPGTVVTQPPNPIFSTSDACIACQKEFPAIRNCSTLIPPATVNLTTIVQILPFYNCLCQKDNMAEIDSLQQCSNCFRSTGQQAFLNVQFYNVTNQQVKAMKQVCEQTVGGTRAPSSGAGGIMLQSAAGWGFVAALASALLLLVLGGL
ncbi:hypothetical protein BGW39_005988 [Mortierella sp. 14UC]|nr:hypothetical protein BGW39_005988 [Mortierella sp. 14UC]